MSHRYAPVGWNRVKLIYDAALAGAIASYLALYQWLAPGVGGPDEPTVAMRAYGSCTFLLLTLVLCIGPSARLDRRLLPLLYNRRHFGVMTWAVAAGHASAVLGWYFSYSRVPTLEALLGADAHFGQVQGFPFIPFGIVAFLVLCVMAFTSHDFWLHFLGPGLWKALHMGVYGAYGLAVLHVAMGALQGAGTGGLWGVVVGSVVLVCGLHLAAGRRRGTGLAGGDWVDAVGVDEIEDGAGVVVRIEGAEAVAIFRDGRRLAAVSNLCAHQNGPLGEGRVIDGCITCPWHGFQYRLEDGSAPAPFTEKLATYRLRVVGRRVWLDPRGLAPGTFVAPVEVPL